MSEQFHDNKYSVNFEMNKTESQVYDRWNSAPKDEALELIEFMKNNPSLYWRDILIKAEAQNINHWQLLLDHSNEIYESIADAIAKSNGIVSVERPEK